MQEIRRQVYGKDIGLHLSPSSRIADLGCGSCGALMDIMAAGQSQVAAVGIAGLLDLQLAGLLRPGAAPAQPRKCRSRLAGEKANPSVRAIATTALASAAASTWSLRAGLASTLTKNAFSWALDIGVFSYSETLGRTLPMGGGLARRVLFSRCRLALLLATSFASGSLPAE